MVGSRHPCWVVVRVPGSVSGPRIGRVRVVPVFETPGVNIRVRVRTLQDCSSTSARRALPAYDDFAECVLVIARS